MKPLYQAWMANDVYDWLFALSIFVLVLLALALARSILRRVLAAFALKKAGMGIDEVVVHVIEGTKLWLLFPVGFYAGMLVLDVSPQLASLVARMTVIAFIAQATVWLNRFIASWMRRQIGRRAADGETITALSMIRFAAQIVVWVLAAMLVLDQLAFDITALVAGLGIGGIAVALAVQNILGDLLASLSIVLDKPFVVGDVIAVGEDKGIVEHIGLKTTRVRAQNGQIIVFSNNDLLKSRIHNYKRMHERRVSFMLEVVYQTKPEALKRIPGMIQRAVEMQEKTRFDRAHLKECGANGFVFETAYLVLDADPRVYMDTHEQVHLEIIRAFEREQIEFACSTQTLSIRPRQVDDAHAEPQRQYMRRLSAT